MVALGTLSPTPTGSTLSATPFLAKTTIPLAHRFPIPSWAPRSGRGIQHYKWWSAVRKLLAAYGLSPDSIYDEVPVESGASAHVSPLSPSPYTEYAPGGGGGGAGVTADERDAWLDVNTSLYWHVHPSVDIDGAHFLQDDRMLESFCSGLYADGRGLLRRLLQFVDASSPALQRALARKLAECTIDAKGATRSALNRHAEVLKQIWELIDGNDLDDPASLLNFWSDLVASMPTAPAESQLVAVRTWLANRIADTQDQVDVNQHNL